MPAHTIIHPAKSASRHARDLVSARFRKPHYDCLQQEDAMTLLVYTPGVEAGGVEITLRGPDLLITARKTHFVRANWAALHLESAQRDYQLALRVGHRFAADAMHAELTDGVLKIRLPRKARASWDNTDRRVA
jgi:HSP20 family molecular chaperone IbpA